MGLINQLEGQKVYLDTNIFIYILEGSKEYKDTLSGLLEAAGSGSVRCFSSELSFAEALVLPFKKGNSKHVEQYSQLLSDEIFVSLIPTVRDIYIKAALYRADLGLTLPDAIHVASALEAECDVFLTNDKGIKVPKHITLLGL